jgi:hypothetical protein
VPDGAKAAVLRERCEVSSRALMLGALALACLAALGVWVAYRELIQYERRAAEHLPTGVGFAGRLDLEQVLLFEPVRRHLFPLIDKLPLTSSPASRSTSKANYRLTRLRELAGVNVGLDLREILVAGGEETDDWVLVLGGLFQRQGLVRAIESLLREEQVPGLAREGDVLSFQPWGIALGQAADGSLILASNRRTLASALPATQRFIELGLARTGAGGFSATPALVRRWLGPAPGLAEDWLSKLRRVGVTLRLGAALELEGRLEVASASDLPFAVSGVEEWLEWTGGGSRFIPQADWGGERAVLARARRFQESETTLKLLSSWQPSELEQATRSLASWLERRFFASATAEPD